MINKRSNIFETNSSSSHSFSFDGGDDVLKYQMIYMHFGQYSTGDYYITSLDGKVSYLMSLICSDKSNVDYFNCFVEALQQIARDYHVNFEFPIPFKDIFFDEKNHILECYKSYDYEDISEMFKLLYEDCDKSMGCVDHGLEHIQGEVDLNDSDNIYEFLLNGSIFIGGCH